MTRSISGPGFEVREDGRARFQNLQQGEAPRQWYRFENVAAGKRAKINIYGDIGDSWWSNSVSAAKFVKDLDDLDVDDIDLHVNSRGGDAFDGITIYNALRANRAKVTVYVDGLAASAASVIAMSGDEIVMGKGAEMMIHDASGLSFGNAADMAKMGEILDKLSQSIAGVYAETAGGTDDEWREAMRAESWYTSDEAVAAKLATRVAKKGEGVSADTSSTPGESGDAEDDDLEDSWRASGDLRVFHYQGRREAPAPKLPVAFANRQNDERTETVPFTDEHLSTMRNALGLPADADESTIVAGLVEALNEQAEPPKTGPSASLPDGVVAVSTDVLDALKADAAAGREAREAQLQARRESLVNEAFRLGKITAKGREGWLNKLKVEGPQAEADLQSLQAGLVPVEEKGHDFGSVADEVSTDDDPDAVRQSPSYQNWRF